MTNTDIDNDVTLENLTTRKIKKYGWTPDLPDDRDHVFAARPDDLVKVPPSVDLRTANQILNKIPMLDQGQLGSCTANGIAVLLSYDSLNQPDNQGNQVFLPSRLFIYYNERVMEHSTSYDAGAMIRDGIKSVNKLGACKEDPTWPYKISQFAKKPPAEAYTEALNHQTISYKRIPSNNLNQMKACLASGFPFTFGFTVYNSFESNEVSKTGIVPMPKQGEKILGGHAVIAVGYDDNKQWFICRNSWGSNWGDKGYFYMPYKYLSNGNLADDFWTITTIEE